MREHERRARHRTDPRPLMAVIMATLLAAGMRFLAFDVTPVQVATVIAGTLATQWACSRLAGLATFDYRSPLISSLGLGLLLRTDSTALALAGAVVSMASKFTLRWNGKHLWNPTAFGLVAMMLATGGAPGRAGLVWVSSGQWGDTLIAGFALACIGLLLVYRAARSDVTFAFLAGWAAILFGRAAWLGQPAALPMHQLHNGALVLFAFFMISDPRTTPDSRAGRVVFGLVVALVAGVIQFGLFRPNGPLWALAACAPLVPLLDFALPGPRHAWMGRTVADPREPKGADHEIPTTRPDPRPRAVAAGRA